jgi:DNA polymerase III alpha subunit
MPRSHAGAAIADAGAKGLESACGRHAIPCNFSNAGRLPRARSARLHRRKVIPWMINAARGTFTGQQYFKTQDEIAQLFADIPSALANTVEIAKRCNLVLELGINRCRCFPTPNNESLDQYLRDQRRLVCTGCMTHLFPDDQIRAGKLPQYQARLEFEVNTIIRWDFPDTF